MRIQTWAAGAACAAGLMLGGAAQAVVLTFDGPICTSVTGVCGNASAISQSYGDTALVDVSGDPNVNGGGAGALLFWDNSYSDLQNVAWGHSGATAGIFIEPIAGYRVTLNSFDLGSYPRQTGSSQWWVYDSLGVLLGSSGGIISILGTTATHVAGPFASQNGIAIHWGPDAFNVGIDNIDYTVSAISGGVPEPGTWAMMILGLGAAGATLRRRRESLVLPI